MRLLFPPALGVFAAALLLCGAGRGGERGGRDGGDAHEGRSDAEAFLYDNHASPPAFLKYLGRNADKARFTAAAAGAPPPGQ
ncbi:MAG: hypothetical protein KGL74_01565 [Elusimicrobia bacterium]|nr:hypothetical protein [Elusimicrobiota bacterium]